MEQTRRWISWLKRPKWTAFKQIERKYELGAVDFLAWNTAAIELAKARYSLVEAKYTYYLKLEILNIYRYF